MNCKFGYDGENTDVTISFHSFPLNDQELTRIVEKTCKK